MGFHSEKSFNAGIDIQLYNKALDEAKNAILNNKEVRRSPLNINEGFIDLVIEAFKEDGKIKDDTTVTEVKISADAFMINGIHKKSSYNPANVFINKSMNYVVQHSNDNLQKDLEDYYEIVRYIIKKINNVRNKFINSFELSKSEEKEVERKNKPEGINYNDFVIASKDRYYKNLAAILLSLDDSISASILENKDSLGEIANLTLFVDLVNGFDKKIFISIMQNYMQSKDKILENAI